MLTDLHIRDYQSLDSAALELGRLTVVTGPSSSGKTALVRALRLLAFNARGTSYIRRGASSCLVRAVGTDFGPWTVQVERGSRGKDAYQVALPVAAPMQPEGYLDQPEVATYTKLGGKVPEQVSQLLRLGEINFAGQFDRPYLLTDSAGEVARQLGELTNVTTIFAAAREGNVRRQRLARQLDEARGEEARLRTEIQRFSGLRRRKLALEAAQEVLHHAQELQQQAERLRQLMTAARLAQAAVGKLAQLPPLPSLEPLEAASARCTRLRQLICTIQQAAGAGSRAALAVVGAEAEQGEYTQQLSDLLARAGVCPVCGQPIRRDA